MFTIPRIVMSKVMQNLFFLMEPSDDAWRTSMKAGNMCLNRFLIDEDAAFELSGVHYLEKCLDLEESWLSQEQKMKGKEL